MATPSSRWAAALGLVLLVGACARMPRGAELREPAQAEAPAAADPEPELRVSDLPLADFDDPARRLALRSAFAEIDAFVEARRVDEDIPGIVVGVVIDDELAYAGSFGVAERGSERPVDEHTLFRIGSITKLFTALAILQLRDAGELALEDPVHRHLPELSTLVYPSPDARPIRYMDLLTHSSGLPRLGRFPYWQEGHVPSEAEVLASIEGLALVRAPGTGYEYSNLGYALLGLALGRIGEGRARDAISTELLAPLGMDNSVWEVAEVPKQGQPQRVASPHDLGEDDELETTSLWNLGAAEAAGGLWSTLHDMGRFAAWQLAAWPPRGGPDDPILARASSREAQTLHYATGGNRYGPRGVGWGWHGRGECGIGQVVGHNGGTEGFRARLTLLPDHGVAVIVLANSAFARTGDYEAEVLHLLRETGGLKPRRPIASPEVEAVARRVVDLLEAFDGERAQAIAAPILRHGSMEELGEDLGWWHGQLGRCEIGRPGRALAIDRARFRLDCDAGPVDLDVHVSLGEPTLWTGFALRTRAIAPPPKVAAAASEVLALLHEWSDEGFERVFAEKWSSDRIADFLERQRAAYGSCELGSTRVRGERSADFDLECETGQARMRVSVDGRDPARITALRITGRNRGPQCGD